MRGKRIQSKEAPVAFNGVLPASLGFVAVRRLKQRFDRPINPATPKPEIDCLKKLRACVCVIGVFGQIERLLINALCRCRFACLLGLLRRRYSQGADGNCEMSGETFQAYQVLTSKPGPAFQEPGFGDRCIITQTEKTNTKAAVGGDSQHPKGPGSLVYLSAAALKALFWNVGFISHPDNKNSNT